MKVVTVEPTRRIDSDSRFPACRQFLGSVIQGDSLIILFGLAVNIAVHVRDNGPAVAVQLWRVK